MSQRFLLTGLGFLFVTLLSCGGKNEPASGITNPDTTTILGQSGPDKRVTDSLRKIMGGILEGELAPWASSFNGINTDSLRVDPEIRFGEPEKDSQTDMKELLSLYQPALVYSPDSNFFIDMYSHGVMLEKRKGKIYASADVDQAVMLYDKARNAWIKLVYFGPSAGIEEAAWINPGTFILAGMIHNDEGKQNPLLIVGNTRDYALTWFSATIYRPDSVEFKPSGWRKMKIDEWE